MVDADHRGQQVLLLAAVDNNQHCEHLICTFDGLLDNQPPLKQDQGIIMGVDVHVCGSFKRFQDPGFKDQFEKKVATVNSHFGLSSGFVLVLS